MTEFKPGDIVEAIHSTPYNIGGYKAGDRFTIEAVKDGLLRLSGRPEGRLCGAGGFRRVESAS
jgi:hypothetical protein